MGVRIKGLDHLLSKVKKLEQVLQVEVDAEMSASVRTIEGDARQAATAHSFDRGRLAGAIIANDTVKFRKKVSVNVYYAPFVEFGTRKKVQVPNGLEAYAAGFRKKLDRGRFKDFVKSIEEWMHRKGINATTGKQGNQKNANKSMAYAIAVKIYRDGVKARPFLFPAFFREEERLVGKIQTLIKDAT